MISPKCNSTRKWDRHITYSRSMRIYSSMCTNIMFTCSTKFMNMRKESKFYIISVHICFYKKISSQIWYKYLFINFWCIALYSFTSPILNYTSIAVIHLCFIAIIKNYTVDYTVSCTYLCAVSLFQHII